MTRGTIILVGEDFVLSSIQFNGDMYIDNYGYGKEVINNLIKIHNPIEFHEFIYEFNKRYHQYYDVNYLTYFMPKFYRKNRTYGFYDRKNYVNFNNAYYERFDSDYLYIKSIKSESIRILDDNDEDFYLNKNEIHVYGFGRFVGKLLIYPNSFYKTYFSTSVIN